ncbi:MAG: biotin transporter BioY [Solirubrobacterales bacterium]|nr:biotin transporter BioY [Solirubrobacterales bacterium]
MSATVPSVSRVPVLADALPGARWRDVVLVIAGAGLTALCAQISIRVPPSPVPITGQTFAVVVAGASLGSTRASASQLLYLLIGLALPVYAAGTHGWSIISGATGGYLVAFPIAAWAIGRLAEHERDRQFLTAFAAYVAGQLIIFGIGVPWLKVSTGLSWSTAIHDGFTIFIVGGLIKAAAAGVLTPVAWRVLRR